MHVLAFRHEPEEHVGWIGDSLAAEGIECRYADRHPPPLEDAAGLIFLGGPQSANDDLDSLRQEIECIRAAAAREIPILGVCLGAQLIAKALGARVYRNAAKEIGWRPVYFTAAAASDPLLGGLTQETIFHWHEETFDLPRGAELLAWSDACRHQAFRAGERIWGFQFHLEVTPEMISCWCAGGSGELDGPVDPQSNAARLGEVARLVFGRWGRMVKCKSS
ncbi:MAG: type 1 glutamine amidotransferase [Bryobacteraceae bacterium]